MNFRVLKITLRSCAAILVIAGAAVFVSGGLSFRTQKQISPDEYVIQHTLILRHSAVLPALAGVVLFVSSLLLPTRHARPKT